MNTRIKILRTSYGTDIRTLKQDSHKNDRIPGLMFSILSRSLSENREPTAEKLNLTSFSHYFR